MIWPNATDYNAAVQNPQLCFRDEDLRQGEAVGDLFGLPRPHSGNFADVYQIQGRDGQSWAIKCFTRPVANLQTRYQAITEHLRQTQRAFMVDFCYLEEGIRIRDHWYPLVKMRWVEGLRLNEFIREHLNKPVLLERLGQLWIRLAQELRDADMGHGDLQHGNVLLVPCSKNTAMSLKLIDYDGMFVPELADRPSGEVGHPNYQHPQRLREGGYDREMDRFAHLLIYTTLHCVRIGGLDLWQRYDSLENLLFREEDFRQPGKSRLLRELWELKDRDSRYLVGHLLLASQGPLLVVPSLDELVDESGIRPLSDSEERQINALLGAVKPRRTKTLLPALAATASAPLKAAAPSTDGLEATPTVEVAALSDTQPIALQAPPLPSQPRSFAEIERDTQPATLAAPPARPFDAAALVDPLVSFLSRPAWLAALGIIALLSFLVVNVMVWSSVKQPTPAPTVRPPTLADIDDVVLKGGAKTPILFAVQRNDCQQALSLRIDGMPDGMTAPPLTLEPDQEKASLTLLAPFGVAVPPRPIHVSLWRGNDKMDEKRFHLSIQRITRPLLEPPENIVCLRGHSTTCRFRIHRNNCRQALSVQFTGLPPQVRQESVPSTEGDSLSVKLTVADKLAVQSIPLNARLRLGDIVVETKPLLLNIKEDAAANVRQEKPTVQLTRKDVPAAVAVEAGEDGELRVSLDRHGYEGNVEMRLEGVPAGATAEPVVTKLAEAKVIIETKEDMKPGKYVLKLLVRVNEQTLDERAIRFTVHRPRGRQEIVHFRTVDHMELTGTLYHGWKGKKGMTVLMLHDLGHDRGSPGWKRLAEALQAEGHSVFTFDFRGHGDSKKVSAAFWTYSVNKYLPLHESAKPADEQPKMLDLAQLPSNYMPWLIEDIAAARSYLDLRHDEKNGPINTFNMVLVGAGQASALGSLWLASEGVRAHADEMKGKIMLKPPEKLSFLHAAWIGMEPKLNGHSFDVGKWIDWSHLVPEVPMTYIYGEDDIETSFFLPVPARERQVIAKARLSGQKLLDQDSAAAKRIQTYLVKTFHSLPPQKWVPRKIKALRSYWVIPVTETPGGRGAVRWFVAKRPGEELLMPVPLERFGISIKGLQARSSLSPGGVER